MPLKVTECGHKDSPVLAASSHKTKIFLTFEKASQPSSAIALPERSVAGLLLLALRLCAGGTDGWEAGGQLTATRRAPESSQVVKPVKGFLCMGYVRGQGARSERHPHSRGGPMLTAHGTACWVSGAPSVSLSGAWHDGCLFLRANSLEAFEEAPVWEGLEGWHREMHMLMPGWEESVGKGSVEERPCT